jgi:hypothetical protein
MCSGNFEFMLRPSTGYLISGSETGDHVASTREKKSKQDFGAEIVRKEAFWKRYV